MNYKKKRKKRMVCCLGLTGQGSMPTLFGYFNESPDQMASWRYEMVTFQLVCYHYEGSTKKYHWDYFDRYHDCNFSSRLTGYWLNWYWYRICNLILMRCVYKTKCIYISISFSFFWDRLQPVTISLLLLIKSWAMQQFVQPY